MAKEDTQGRIISAVSGEVTKISGETVSVGPATAVKTGPQKTNISAASGGAYLYSGAVISMTVKVNSGDMYIGGEGTDCPWDGQGLLLEAGEAVTLDVDDFGDIKACAAAGSSGDNMLTFIGVN